MTGISFRRMLAATFVRGLHARYDGRRARLRNRIMIIGTVPRLRSFINRNFYMINNYTHERCLQLIRNYEQTQRYLMIRNNPIEALRRLR